MGKKSSEKGASFERMVCRFLSSWVSGGTTEDLFWRTPGSGARASTHYRTGHLLTRQCGDIGAVDPIGEELLQYVFIECKHVKDLQLAQWMCHRPSTMSRYCLKVSHQARLYRKIPWLIVRQNRYPILLVMQTSRWVVDIPSLSQSLLACRYLGPADDECYVYDFQRFIRTTPYQVILRRIQGEVRR